jgi:inosose dehydratase
VEAAKRHAALQAELGNTEVFIAASLTPERMAHPAVGADASEATLRRVIDGLSAAAAAITSEGVTPALHPHVGSTSDSASAPLAVSAGGSVCVTADSVSTVGIHHPVEG